METGVYLFQSTNDFLGNTIYSYIFSLFELPSVDYPKKYLLIYIYDKKYILQIISFSGFSLDITKESNYNSTIVSFDNRIVSSFILDSLIILFYVDSDSRGKYYRIRLYNFNLDILGNADIDQINDFNEGIGIFSKSYHLKDRYAIFLYYKGMGACSLTLKIGIITNSNTFSERLTKSVNEYCLQTNVLMNDLFKINDERLAFYTFKETTLAILNILLFDFFNDYYNLKIREYEIPLPFLQAKIEIAGNIFNNILVFSSTVSYIGSEEQFSIFMMFGYVNGTDEIIDISKFFNYDDNNEEINLVTKLTENITIDNNIFGYELNPDNIKLVLIPEEILFFNKSNENIKLNNDNILNKNYLLKQNEEIVKTDKYYYLDYQIIIQEPDYDIFNEKSKNIINFSYDNNNEDQKNYFIQKHFYGRINRIKFKLCHNSCSNCRKFGKSNDNQQCLSCLNNSKYDESSQNCFPEEYSHNVRSTIPSIIIQNNISSTIIQTSLPTSIIQTTIPSKIIHTDIQSTIDQTIIQSSLIESSKTSSLIQTSILSTIIQTTINLTINQTSILSSTIHTTKPSTINQTTIPSIIIQNDIHSTIIKTTISSTIAQTNIQSIIIQNSMQLTIIQTSIPSIINKNITNCLSYLDLLNNQCIFSTKNNDIIYNILKSEIIKSYPEDGESILIEVDDDYVFHLTNEDNEMESLSRKFENYYNLSIIDLGNYEKLLKEKYYIKDNISLIILKFEKLTNIASEKNVQYEIYEPYNKTKLDLSICQNTSIDLYIPIKLSNKTKILYDD